MQIYIEATIGGGYAGDIAIDDVVITDSSCGKNLSCIKYKNRSLKLIRDTA